MTSEPSSADGTKRGRGEVARGNARAGGRWVVPILASLLVGGGLLAVLAWSGFPLVPRWESFVALDVAWLLAGELCIVVAFLIRAARMRHLARALSPISLREVLAIEWWSQGANFVLPFRLGELVRPGLYATRGGMSLPAAAAATFADRLLEGLVLLVVFAVALPLGDPIDPLPASIGEVPISTVVVPVFAYLVIGAYVLLFVLLLALPRVSARLAGPLATSPSRSGGEAPSERTGGSTSDEAKDPAQARSLAARLARVSGQLHEGLSVLRSWRIAVVYLGETFAYWLASAASFVCVAWAMGLDEIGIVRGWAVLGTFALGMVLPAAPGYLGSYQAAGYAGLALYLSAELVLGPGSELIAISYALTWLNILAFAVLGAWISPARHGLGAADAVQAPS